MQKSEDNTVPHDGTINNETAAISDSSKFRIPELPQFDERHVTLNETNSAPGISARRIEVANCKGIPPGLNCFELLAEQSKLEEIPEDIQIWYHLLLSGSLKLRQLPRGLRVDILTLRNCVALEDLPEDLDIFSLDVSGCTNLKQWPESANFKAGRLGFSGCPQITSVPRWLKKVSELDVSGCENLVELPDDLEITGCIHVDGSGLLRLPEKSRGVQIRWRGVLANELIAFNPEKLTPQMVLEEENIERRRIMLERMGIEKFMTEADAIILHQDRDAGGERSLLTVPIDNDEDLVCLNVLCPSTGRRYIIRVPPTITTCHAAAAWIAGFEDPSQYSPLLET